MLSVFKHKGTPLKSATLALRALIECGMVASRTAIANVYLLNDKTERSTGQSITSPVARSTYPEAAVTPQMNSE